MLKINTEKLKSILTLADNGASHNKFVPITNLISISVKDNKLTTITTDGTNFLYVSDDQIQNEDFAVVAELGSLIKLVSKLTTPDTKLSVKDNKLFVKANGNYQFGLPLNNDGKPMEFPDMMAKVKLKNGISMNPDDVKVIDRFNKPAASTNLEVVEYTGYCVKEAVYTTDSYTIACFNKDIFAGNPVLLSSRVFDLICLFKDDFEVFLLPNDIICATNKEITIYGKNLTGMENYPVDAIKGLLEGDTFPYNCQIDRKQLLDALDRLTLFIGLYDNNVINMNFDNGKIIFSTLDGNNNEAISCTNFNKFKSKVNIERLIIQIKSFEDETIDVYFGDNSSIKVVEKDTTKLIALENEDE